MTLFSLVEIPDDKLIDWDAEPLKVFMDATGKRTGNPESFGVSSDQIHKNLVYDYAVVPTGAVFTIYRLPGSTEQEVDELKAHLKNTRDVVGHILAVKLEVRVKFDCPMTERRKGVR